MISKIDLLKELQRTRPLDVDGAHRRYREALKTAYPFVRVCEGFSHKCETTVGVELESSRTMYPWDGKGENPNKKLWLCRECAKEHHDEWDAVWSEYNAGLM